MALYNVERPMTFDEVLGQDKNVRIFKEILKSGVLPNAFLFIGVRGTGKTTCARLFERALNCEHPKPDGSPCNECPACKEALNGTSMDVVELDAASHGGVDDVHEVLKMIQYTPVHKKKILVLDEVHMLSSAAFNALLKTIEEPPKDVVFIFCTTEEHKVPATIVSRCRRFVFERISDEVIEGKLQEIVEKNGLKADKEALGIIARAAKGGMRDALSILEQFMQGDITTEVVKETLGIADEDAVFSILSAVAKGDVVSAVKTFRAMVRRGKSLEILLKALIDGCIDAVYTIQTGEKVNNTQLYLEGVDAFIKASDNDASKILSYVDQLSKVYEISRKDADMSFALEQTLMKMVDYTSELVEIKARLERLEQGVVVPAKVTNDAPVAEAVPTEEIQTEEVPFEVYEQYASQETSLEEEPQPVEKPVESVKIEGINMPVEIANEDPVEEIPLSNSLDGFEMGDEMSLTDLLGDNEPPKAEEPRPTVDETPVSKEDADVVEEEPAEDPFADFFSISNARQL